MESPVHQNNFASQSDEEDTSPDSNDSDISSIVSIDSYAPHLFNHRGAIVSVSHFMNPTLQVGELVGYFAPDVKGFIPKILEAHVVMIVGTKAYLMVHVPRRIDRVVCMKGGKVIWGSILHFNLPKQKRESRKYHIASKICRFFMDRRVWNLFG